EDFELFKEILNETTQYVFEEKGEEVISERHQKDFKKTFSQEAPFGVASPSFTDLNFEDI
ncbi:MAG: DUF3276 family protein, partial [Capnocytophaga sp.]|nr:DUF3276 family protein [Capnocytophaga sp.]